jgi:hypothetical protein
MEQPLGMILSLHIEGGDGEHFAVQRPKNVLLDDLISVNLSGLVQREPLGCFIGGINAPLWISIDRAHCGIQAYSIRSQVVDPNQPPPQLVLDLAPSR